MPTIPYQIAAEWTHALAMTDAPPLRPLIRWLARQMYPYPPTLRVMPIVWHDVHAREAPRLWVLADAGMSAHSSAVFQDGTVHLPRVAGASIARANYAAPPVISHGRRYAYVSPPEYERTISTPAFSLLGNGAFNYYHWLIELLPRLRHLPEARDRYPDLVVLAPQSVADTPQLRDALDLLLPGDVAIDYVHADELVTAPRLIVPHHATFAVFNKRGAHRFEARDFWFDAESVHWLHERLMAALDVVPGAARTRLFLARKGNRAYNQAEILGWFKRYGFEPIYLETLSLREQAQALADAEAIAGPTGASWSNLLFARRGSRAFYWLPEEYGDFRAFPDMAHALGVEISALSFPTGATSTASLYQRPHVVPLQDVARAFEPGLNKLSEQGVN